MQNKLQCPILLIAFNRPHETAQVLAAIKLANPSKLYIGLDGARPGNHLDQANCINVKRVIAELEIDAEVIVYEQKTNLGCRGAVVAAIDWFFENEEYGIILEDDIVPHEAFFDFVSTMLNLYKLDSQINAVLGFNLYGQGVVSDDFFFYEGFYPWGWGTWRDRWLNYSKDDFDIQSLENKKLLGTANKNVLNSLILNLSLVKSGLLDTWDYQFMYMMASQGGLAIAPYANMIRNIGANGAHSTNNNLDFNYGSVAQNIAFEKKDIVVDEKLNHLFFNEHYQSRFIIFVKMLILRSGLYPIAQFFWKKFKI